MSNPYTITITSAEQVVNGAGDYLQMIMVFSIPVEGTSVAYTATEKGIFISDWGVLEWGYDFEDALMVAGNWQVKLGDRDGYLGKLFFGKAADLPESAADKRAVFTLKLNGVLHFTGRLQEDAIEYSTARREVGVSVLPNTRALNVERLFDDDNDPLCTEFTDNTYYALTDYLDAIFQRVNAGISYVGGQLVIDSNVKYLGDYDGTHFCYTDILIEELEIYSHRLWFQQQTGVVNVADVLRKLAMDLCCYTGLIHDSKAFFKKLFVYDAGNVQALGRVLNFDKTYRYGLLDYVKVTYTDVTTLVEKYTNGSRDTRLANNRIERELLAPFCWDDTIGAVHSHVKGATVRVDMSGFFISVPPTVAPVVGDTYSNNGSTFEIVFIHPHYTGYYTTKRVAGTNLPDASGTLTRVTGSGDAALTYTITVDLEGIYSSVIWQAKDDTLADTDWKDGGQLVCDFWWERRSDMAKCRVDPLLVEGITYDFLKCFNHDGNKYQVMNMKVFLSGNVTQFDGIYLGEL